MYMCIFMYVCVCVFTYVDLRFFLTGDRGSRRVRTDAPPEAFARLSRVVAESAKQAKVTAAAAKVNSELSAVD